MKSNSIALPPTKEPKIERINTLFTRFAAIYGGLWTSRLPNQQALQITQETWERGLNAFNDEQIVQGLQKCIDPFFAYVDHPPTLGQFIQLCLPSFEEMGFPVPDEAYHQTSMPEEKRHRMVNKTLDYINNYTFKLMSEKEGRKRFLDTYNLLVKKELKRKRSESFPIEFHACF